MWYSGDYAKLMEESVFTSPSPEKQSQNEKEEQKGKCALIGAHHLAGFNIHGSVIA